MNIVWLLGAVWCVVGGVGDVVTIAILHSCRLMKASLKIHWILWSLKERPVGLW